MKVILKETIDTLGIVGSECKVAPGYARNYLFPRGKAIASTPQNKKVIEQARIKFELQIAKEKKLAQEMAERVKGIECIIKAKVYEEVRLYGSVTTHDIKAALDAQNVSIERRSNSSGRADKMAGEYKVPVRLYKDVEPEITVKVIAEEGNS